MLSAISTCNLCISMDEHDHSENRDDVIESIAPDYRGLAYDIRDITTYPDDRWLVETMFLFYPEMFERDIDSDVILNLTITNEMITKIHQLDQLVDYTGLDLIERICKILDITQSTEITIKFPSMDYLEEILLDYDIYNILEDRGPTFISFLVQSYYMKIQPTYINRKLFRDEYNQSTLISLQLSKQMAVELSHTTSTAVYDVNKLAFALVNQLYQQLDYILEFLEY